MDHDTLIKEFESYLEVQGYRERSIEVRIASVKMYLKYAQEESLDIYRITMRESESYREYLRCALRADGKARFQANTINKELSYVRLVYRYLVKMERVMINPFMYMERMKEVKRLPRNILTEKEMGDFLDSIEVKDVKSFRFKVACETLYASACRIRELEEIEREDIHLEEGYMLLRDDKSRRDRIAVLNEYSCELLKLYLLYHESAYPFRGRVRRVFNIQMNEMLHEHSCRCALPKMSCHGFRHSAATHLLKSGADIREVQEYLGHVSIADTEIYTRVCPEDLKAIVDAVHPREGGRDAG